jgi:hypothetical protein
VVSRREASMGVEVGWDDDEKTILRWASWGAPTTEEFEQAVEVVKELLAETDGPVCLIIDDRDLDRVPPDLLSRFPQIAGDMPGRLKRAIVVGAGGPARAFSQMFSRVFEKPELVATLEEAYALIEEAGES